MRRWSISRREICPPSKSRSNTNLWHLLIKTIRSVPRHCGRILTKNPHTLATISQMITRQLSIANWRAGLCLEKRARRINPTKYLLVQHCRQDKFRPSQRGAIQQYHRAVKMIKKLERLATKIASTLRGSMRNVSWTSTYSRCSPQRTLSTAIAPTESARTHHS